MHWVPCSETMENAFGYGYNLAEKYGPLSPQDVAFYWSLREPVLSGIRQRVYLAQDVLEALLRAAVAKHFDRKLRVLFVGAGRLPELRRRGFPLEYIEQMEIVAVDEDKGVWDNIDGLFRYTFGKTVGELDIQYYNMSFLEFVRGGKWNGYFDVIIAQGVMSYYNNTTQTINMLRDMRSLLGANGIVIMDLQLFHISLLRCKFALDWNTNPPLSPDMSEGGARKRIQKACAAVGLDIIHTKLFRTDSRPNSPKIGVGFVLRRNGNWAV